MIEIPAKIKGIVLLGMVLVLGCSLWAQHKTSTRAVTPAQTTSPQELFKRVSPSVFAVEVLDANDSVIAFGSGIAVAPDEVVTNRHVIDAGSIWRVRRGTKTWRAFVTWVDPDHDLGLLEAAGLDALPVSLRLSPTPAVGERVYAIGTPEGLELTFSEGIVSGLREYENGYVIQTSAPVSPGSSGGGLFDEQGRLVGITSFGLIEGQNLNFALSAEWVQALARLRAPLSAQTPANQQQLTKGSKEVFSDAGAVLFNFEGLFSNMRRDRHPDHPLPHIGAAAWWLHTQAVVFECIKDQSSPNCFDNWPLWQRASLFMLQLRQEIQAAEPARDDFETTFLGAASSQWSKVRDIYCQDRPGGLYTDLEGKIRRCP
jgi:hypothetical protein